MNGLSVGHSTGSIARGETVVTLWWVDGGGKKVLRLRVKYSKELHWNGDVAKEL